MNPGRELDALVAEKVFGFERGPDVLPDGPCIRILEGPAKGRFGYPKPYSTSIEAAWEVVGKLNEMGLAIAVIQEPEAKAAQVYPETENLDESGGWTYADTVYHAICLAALKAVGYDPENRS